MRLFEVTRENGDFTHGTVLTEEDIYNYYQTRSNYFWDGTPSTFNEDWHAQIKEITETINKTISMKDMLGKIEKLKEEAYDEDDLAKRLMIGTVDRYQISANDMAVVKQGVYKGIHYHPCCKIALNPNQESGVLISPINDRFNNDIKVKLSDLFDETDKVTYNVKINYVII